MYRTLDADTNSEKFGAQRKYIAKRWSMFHTADYLMNNSTRWGEFIQPLYRLQPRWMGGYDVIFENYTLVPRP